MHEEGKKGSRTEEWSVAGRRWINQTKESKKNSKKM